MYSVVSLRIKQEVEKMQKKSSLSLYVSKSLKRKRKFPAVWKSQVASQVAF